MIRRKTIPPIIIALLSWSAIGFVIFFLPPNQFTLAIFHLVLILALFSLLSLPFGYNRHAFVFAIGISLFFLLRLWRMAHAVNIILLISIIATLEILWVKR